MKQYAGAEGVCRMEKREERGKRAYPGGRETRDDRWNGQREARDDGRNGQKRGDSRKAKEDRTARPDGRTAERTAARPKERTAERTANRGPEQTAEADGVIEGRNAVIEALRAGVWLDKVYLQKGDADRALGFIASRAREAGAVVVDADRRKLDAMSRTHAHQGVIALAAVREYVPLEELFRVAEERGEPPFLVVCDEISDPGNLGAILRTAECAGAHGVILPKRRSAGLTAVVAKTSAGAVAHIRVCRVANLSAALDELKKRGVWVYGAAAEGENALWRTDLRGPIAVVIGSEGTGMTRLVREKCDALVSIPLRGKTGSLNASAAAAVLLYEAVRQRESGPVSSESES